MTNIASKIILHTCIAIAALSATNARGESMQELCQKAKSERSLVF